ncbi:hypothetical protein EJB05_45728 [Eragrostis curvula]|uniref:Uncharacterized protein n=1 Tax=Eragrostis curvula TaxID=38414 RepID=A0A5J9TN75_9POAL|nr:hypothetical protein EJB05_45728 [Eragrostis curvula]
MGEQDLDAEGVGKPTRSVHVVMEIAVTYKGPSQSRFVTLPTGIPRSPLNDRIPERKHAG